MRLLTTHVITRRTATVRTSLLAVGLAATVALTGCSQGSAAPSADSSADGCVTDFEPGKDYFPDKQVVEDAENFSLSYHDHYQVLTVQQPYPGGKPTDYVLVKCGTPDPELDGALAGATRVEVPVRSIYSGSTTHLPAIVELGALESLTGVSNGSYVSAPEVVERFEAGDVAEYAADGAVDTEKVVLGDPDVLVTGGTDDPAYAKVSKAGIPVVANAEWLEATPLGRAEWIKMFAALTGTEAEAARDYDRIKTGYADVVEKVSGAEEVPVLVGNLYQGTWHMPAGGSYVGRLLADAGATYPWEKNRSVGSLELDFEAVYAKAGDAPTWLINDTTVETVKDLTALDPKYRQLAAPRDGEVWNATRSLGPNGGNDYWERGVLRPDLVLADLAALLHPDLLPDHEFTFYQPVTAP